MDKTTELKLPNPIGKNATGGYGVFHWPEFIAFANRLGLPLDQRIKALTIYIEVDSPVEIDAKFFAVDMKEE